jgi:hypothetical protein
MSKTSYYAQMIKQQLEDLRPGLGQGDPAKRTIDYVLTRLWPELESAIEQELRKRDEYVFD